MHNELTEDQIHGLIHFEIWKELTSRERAEYQLRNEIQFMPWDVWQQALMDELGRAVSTEDLFMLTHALLAEVQDGNPLYLSNLVAKLPEGWESKIQGVPHGNAR